jgi:hypothetical protein
VALTPRGAALRELPAEARTPEPKRVMKASASAPVATRPARAPSRAVKQLEQIAWSLGQLSPGDQKTFRVFAHRTAESYANPAVASEIVSVVDGLLTAPEE